VAAQPLATPSLSLCELPGLTVLRLHSLEAPTALTKATREHGIPLAPQTGSAAGEDPAALCLRPGEWLLISERLPASDLIEVLEPGLDPSLTALHDLSHGLGIFRLSGPAAPWLLAKFSGLDFLAGVSAGQHAARTRMADVAVVLHFHQEPSGTPLFDLLFDRSHARYLWGLLNDAAPHAEELFTHHGAAT